MSTRTSDSRQEQKRKKPLGFRFVSLFLMAVSKYWAKSTWWRKEFLAMALQILIHGPEAGIVVPVGERIRSTQRHFQPPTP